MVIRYQSLTGQDTQYRVIPDTMLREHGYLCRAFSLDPVRTRFDLPRETTGKLRFEGVVLFSGEPIGRLFECRESDRYRDIDPSRDGWERQTR